MILLPSLLLVCWSLMLHALSTSLVPGSPFLILFPAAAAAWRLQSSCRRPAAVLSAPLLLPRPLL